MGLFRTLWVTGVITDSESNFVSISNQTVGTKDQLGLEGWVRSREMS